MSVAISKVNNNILVAWNKIANSQSAEMFYTHETLLRATHEMEKCGLNEVTY